MTFCFIVLQSTKCSQIYVHQYLCDRRHFQQYFSYIIIVVVCVIGGVPVETHKKCEDTKGISSSGKSKMGRGTIVVISANFMVRYTYHIIVKAS